MKEMKKYIAPKMEVVEVKTEYLMQSISNTGSNAGGSVTDNLSRRGGASDDENE